MSISKWYRYIVLFLLLIILGNVPALITRTTMLTDTDVSEVDLVFVYGVKAGRSNPVNRLDTRVDTFTKDMVADPSITFRLILSDENMTRILDKLKEIEFHKYPSLYLPPFTGIMGTPYSTYQLTLYMDGVPVKTVRIDTDTWSDDAKTQNLQSLFALIREIIRESPEYLNSPKPTSGYC